MALTELSVKALKPKEKIYRMSDGAGLCIEVTPNGSKLWRWRYTYEGKGQMLALGKYPAMTIAQARKARDAAREQLDAGKHPTREKKAVKLLQAHNGANTFEKIARRWLEEKHRAMNQKYRKQCLRRMEQHVFPAIGNLPIAEITVPDVARIIDTISKPGRNETARRMGQLISQTFRYGMIRGICNHNPASNVRDFLDYSRNEKHHACIPISQVPDLLRDIKNYKGDLLTVLLIRLLALTFVRTREIVEARWEEIDWDKREWHIPKERMKRRRPHMVPLSAQSIEILKEIQKITGDKPHIFHSSRSKQGCYSNGVVLMALKRMNYKGRMTGHGFRSMASTILNERGYLPDAIECQLAHIDNDKTRSAYNRADYIMERKKMMQDYADYLDSLISETEDNVFLLGSKKRA